MGITCIMDIANFVLKEKQMKKTKSCGDCHVADVKTERCDECKQFLCNSCQNAHECSDGTIKQIVSGKSKSIVDNDCYDDYDEYSDWLIDNFVNEEIKDEKKGFSD